MIGNPSFQDNGDDTKDQGGEGQQDKGRKRVSFLRMFRMTGQQAVRHQVAAREAARSARTIFKLGMNVLIL